MIDFARILRAAADLVDGSRRDRATRGNRGTPEPSRETFAVHDCLEPFDDLVDEDGDWRRWYDEHRRGAGEVPAAVVNACLDDIREAGILHSVAILEIARKWGLDART